MMDRDGRLLETWGGRRRWNSSSCFYLLHTHTFLCIHILGWLTCVHSPKPCFHSHLHSCTHMQAHVHTLARDLPELNALACLRAGGCRVLLQGGLHLLPPKLWAVYTYFCAALLLKILLAFCSYPTRIHPAPLQPFVGSQRSCRQRNTIKISLTDLLQWIYVGHEFSLSDALTSLAY